MLVLSAHTSRSSYIQVVQVSHVIRRVTGKVQSAMTAHLLDRIKNCKTLPAVPSLPLQILQMCRDERTECKQMAEVISKDPSFVAKLLNVANSSFYGGARHKVTTVTQAVTLLGMNSIATLAFCFSLYRDLRRKGGEGFNHAQHWQRSILASLAARVVARWKRFPNYEEIFLAALLQDLGVLVLSETVGPEYDQLYHQAGRSHVRLEEMERQMLETDHAEVGAWLAGTWELPEVMQVAVAGSHAPDHLPVPEAYRSAVQSVALSGRLADLWCEEDTHAAIITAVEASRRFLAIEASDLVQLVKEIREGIPDMSSFFQIQLVGSDELDQVVSLVERTVVELAAPEPAAP